MSKGPVNLHCISAAPLRLSDHHQGRKIAHWRDYLDPLAVIAASAPESAAETESFDATHRTNRHGFASNEKRHGQVQLTPGSTAPARKHGPPRLGCTKRPQTPNRTGSNTAGYLPVCYGNTVYLVVSQLVSMTVMQIDNPDSMRITCPQPYSRFARRMQRHRSTGRQHRPSGCLGLDLSARSGIPDLRGADDQHDRPRDRPSRTA